MSILVSALTVARGASQRLEIARGEDREFRITFTDAGTPIDLSGAQSIIMTVRARTTGALIFARSYSGFQGTGADGTPRFQVLQADTVNIAEVPYDVDIDWTDASGFRWQLLVASTFSVLQAVGDTTDVVTTPPAVPVAYGLNWAPSGYPGFWTAVSGGYRVNDAVMAYDGSLGSTGISTFRALSAGVTAYPLTTGQSLATGWAYIGQHGGNGGASSSLTVTATHGTLQIGNTGSGDSDHHQTSTYTPVEIGSSTWREWVGQFTNSGSSRKNQVYRRGWNIGAGGGIHATGEPALADEWESFYAPGGGLELMERHIAYVDTTSTVHRPLSILANRNTNGLQVFLQADDIELKNAAGNAFYCVGPSSAFCHTPNKTFSFYADDSQTWIRYGTTSQVLCGDGVVQVSPLLWPLSDRGTTIGNDSFRFDTVYAVDYVSLANVATSGATLKNSGSFKLTGRYYSGGVSNDLTALLQHVVDSTAPTSHVLLSIAGTQVLSARSDIVLELSDGQSSAVSGSGKGAIRYNNATKRLQYSVDGGAWTNI